MNQNAKKLLSVSLLIIIIGFFIYYIYTHTQDFKELKFINPSFILILILTGFFVIFNNGIGTKFLLESFNVKLKFKEWFGLSSITSFYNLITPFKGGAISRALYLKTKHNFSYENFLATLSGSHVIIILITSIIGLFSTLAIYSIYGILSLPILLFLTALIIPLLIVVIFSPKLSNSKNNILNKLINIINGWHSIKSNKKVILMFSSICLINLVLNTFSVIITYKILGIHLSIYKALFLTSIGSLSVIVAITPGGLGINEAIAVFLASIIGITPAQSLTASIISRTVSILVIFALGPLFSYILIKKEKAQINKNGN